MIWRILSCCSSLFSPGTSTCYPWVTAFLRWRQRMRNTSARWSHPAVLVLIESWRRSLLCRPQCCWLSGEDDILSGRKKNPKAKHVRLKIWQSDILSNLVRGVMEGTGMTEAEGECNKPHWPQVTMKSSRFHALDRYPPFLDDHPSFPVLNSKSSAYINAKVKSKTLLPALSGSGSQSMTNVSPPNKKNKKKKK